MSSAAITAASILALLISTAGAGLIIFRQVERDRVRQALAPSTCPRCRRGTHVTYRAGRQVWVHNIGGREQCWKPPVEQPMPTVPVSPGRSR